MHKSFSGHAEIKDAEQGIAEVVVSCYGNVDFDGDIVVKGASAKQIKGEYGPNPKGMLDHDWSMRSAVAKTVDWWEEDDGLHVKAQYNLNKQVGREAFDDLKFYGEDMQFSVGYEIKDSERAGQTDRDKGIRRIIKEWVINEWSHVMLGANDQTHLVSLKQRKRDDEKAIVGSFEQLREQLTAGLRDTVSADSLWVRATFPDRVVFDVENDGVAGYSCETYEATYELGADGALSFGDPVEVTVDEVVAPKTREPDVDGDEAVTTQGIDARRRDEFRHLVASTLI